MAGIPKETLTTTLLLVGMGFAIVVALLVFAFSILNDAGGGGFGEGIGQPTTVPGNFPPTPTPEFIPNNPIVDGS